MFTTIEGKIYDYCPFFGFKEAPFSLVPHPELFFPSKSHLETFHVLLYALNTKSLFTVLTGQPGLGKTQVLLTLISKLKDDIQPIIIYNSSIKPDELFYTLLTKLNLPFMSDHFNKEKIITTLREHFSNSKKRYLLVLDEAQLLPYETLEELRLLTNLNEGSNIFIQVFLVGQPSLEDKLKNPTLIPLRQRISLWESLKPLSREEILPYLWFRIKQVASTPNLILDKKIEKTLYKYSGGIPRLINKIMDRALFIAYFKREVKITEAYLKEAFKTFRSELISR